MRDEAIETFFLESFPGKLLIPRQKVVLYAPELLVGAMRPAITGAALRDEHIEGAEHADVFRTRKA